MNPKSRGHWPLLILCSTPFSGVNREWTLTHNKILSLMHSCTQLSLEFTRDALYMDKSINIENWTIFFIRSKLLRCPGINCSSHWKAASVLNSLQGQLTGYKLSYHGELECYSSETNNSPLPPAMCQVAIYFLILLVTCHPCDCWVNPFGMYRLLASIDAKARNDIRISSEASNTFPVLM